jgi:hypothetical protein
MNCPGHEPASTRTPGPTITSRLSCGRIADVEAPVAEPHSRALLKRVEARTGLTITHHRIDFFGRCRECQTKGALGPADVALRRMSVLPPRIFPHGERAGGMVTDWFSGKLSRALCHDRSEPA